MLHDEQAEQAAFARAVALADACIKSESGALRQAEALVMVTKILGEHLNEADRHRLAAYMLDVALKLVRWWH
jgi:hypothetical protein